jgi:pyruvate dehydrogenase (quinone)
MMNGCDTLLMVGSSFPYSEYLPPEGQARGVQIDIDGRKLALRYPMEVNLVGDSRRTLQALLPLLEHKANREWQQKIADHVGRWWRVLEARAMNDAEPINPQRVFWELSKQLPDGCILTCDSGTAAAWYARDLKMRRGMMASLSGGLATMGPAVPYAIAAKLAYPDRPVIALLGDGAMQMIGMNGLITVADRYTQWRDPRLVVMVLNNGDLNMVTWEQRVSAGNRRYEASQALPRFAYAEYGQLLGLNGIRVDRPEAIAGAWEQALRSDRPTLLEMVTDPNVPPLPPHVTSKQMRSYAKALMQRDPQAMDTLIATAKEWWDGIMGGRGDKR